MIEKPIDGASYFLRGAQLIARPGLRLFVIIPFLINLLIYSVLSYWAIEQFAVFMDYLFGMLPDWEWLKTLAKWLLSILFGLFLLITMGYTFTLVANLIAAPFNGYLAEKVEILLTGKEPPPEGLVAMTFRTIGRELRKWMYFFPRLLGILFICFILYFIPLLNLLIPVIMFIWGAWCMNIQYIDYPIDNHQLPFEKLKQEVSKHKHMSLGFGSVVMLAASIPIVNFFVMPVAVAGATALWIEKIREEEDNGEDEQQKALN